MCITGLRMAIKLLGDKKKWLQTKNEMSAVFNDMYNQKTQTIPRTYTFDQSTENKEVIKDDSWPDSSLLGLIFPCDILDPFDSKMEKTVNRIITITGTKFDRLSILSS